MNKLHNRLYLVSSIAICLGLTGCSMGDTQDLQTYVQDVRNRQQSRIEPLPEFKPYETFLYQANDLRSPFDAGGPVLAEQAIPGSGSNIHPDSNRPREPLEEFPLDTLRMVGTLEQKGQSWGLVVTSDGTIHRIQPGNYAGQNHGKIKEITEYEIALTEIVPDGLGGWIERPATLALSE